MEQWTRDQAERELVAWAQANACRDDLIRAAYLSGVTKSRIYEITGIARTTIDRILKEHAPRRGLMQMASREGIAAFLIEFTQDWPRDPRWQGNPFPFRPRPAMADQITPDELASQLLEAVGFRTLRLGSLLNIPDGELIAEAVGLLIPPPYDVDANLLIEALKIAANRQRTAELDKAMGFGVVAAIAAVVFAGSRS